MRKNLKEARQKAGMTQQQMADALHISLVYYQKIEAGSRTGDFAIWDRLEDITGISQRKLREILENHPDRANGQQDMKKAKMNQILEAVKTSCLKESDYFDTSIFYYLAGRFPDLTIQECAKTVDLLRQNVLSNTVTTE